MRKEKCYTYLHSAIISCHFPSLLLCLKEFDKVIDVLINDHPEGQVPRSLCQKTRVVQMSLHTALNYGSKRR